MKNEIQAVLLKGLDEWIPPLREAHAAAKTPARGWLRAIREALGLTQAQVAVRATVKRQSYAQLETAEMRGAISIASLRRAAEAMDCELIYYIVPRESVASTYTELAQANDPTFKHLKATEHSMVLEGQAVGGVKIPQAQKRSP